MIADKLLKLECLDRRIPDIDTLRREVLAQAEKRNLAKKAVHWKFSQIDARNKLQRHYDNVQKFN